MKTGFLATYTDLMSHIDKIWVAQPWRFCHGCVLDNRTHRKGEAVKKVKKLKDLPQKRKAAKVREDIEGVSLCVSLRLGVFARCCWFFHSFKGAMCAPPEIGLLANGLAPAAKGECAVTGGLRRGAAPPRPQRGRVRPRRCWWHGPRCARGFEPRRAD